MPLSAVLVSNNHLKMSAWGWIHDCLISIHLYCYSMKWKETNIQWREEITLWKQNVHDFFFNCGHWPSSPQTLFYCTHDDGHVRVTCLKHTHLVPVLCVFLLSMQRLSQVSDTNQNHMGSVLQLQVPETAYIVWSPENSKQSQLIRIQGGLWIIHGETLPERLCTTHQKKKRRFFRIYSTPQWIEIQSQFHLTVHCMNDANVTYLGLTFQWQVLITSQSDSFHLWTALTVRFLLFCLWVFILTVETYSVTVILLQ